MRLMSCLLLLAACGGSVSIGDDTDEPVDTDEPADTDVAPGPIEDLTQPGPAPALQTEGSLAVGDGCTLEYTLFRPDGARGEALVVLAHGFARSRAQMAGWAAHWASYGAEVVTPQLCFLRFTNTDHPANGRHLVALADQLAGDRPVIFAGYSAGGLAATLAASQRPGSDLLVLDGVDNEGLGEAAAADVDGSVAALWAEPSRCNADGNGEAMLAPAEDRRGWRITGSDHCDFESPTDRVCTALCGGGEADDAAVERIILGMTTGFVLWQGELDPRGAEYWTSGEEAFEGVADGIEVP